MRDIFIWGSDKVAVIDRKVKNNKDYKKCTVHFWERFMVIFLAITFGKMLYH